MGKRKALEIEMSIYQQRVLEKLARKQKTGQQQVLRINIILQAVRGQNNSAIKRNLKVSLNTVKTWRKRWFLAYKDLLQVESKVEIGKITDLAYRKQIIKLFENLPRSGAPKRITLAQEKQIIALACDKPVNHGLEITDWTHIMLAKTAMVSNIISTISAKQVGRILKKKPIKTSQIGVLALPKN